MSHFVLRTFPSLLFALFFVFGTSSFAFAQTDDTPSGNTGIYFCPTLSQTMSRGARDATTYPQGQVTQLQTFLTDFFDLNPQNSISGFFGRQTQSTLIKFQTQYGLPAYGIAGTLTRAKIAEVCKGSTTIIIDPLPPKPVCTTEYAPVCGYPKMPSCPKGYGCPAVMPALKTYSNKCQLEAEAATFVKSGACDSVTICPVAMCAQLACPTGQHFVHDQDVYDSHGCVSNMCAGKCTPDVDMSQLQVTRDQSGASDPLKVAIVGPASLLEKIKSCVYTHGWYGAGGNGVTIDWGDGTFSPNTALVDSRMGQSCADDMRGHTYTSMGSTFTIKAKMWHPGPTDGSVTDWEGSVQFVTPSI